VDNRPEAVAQRKFQEITNNSPQAKQLAQLQAVTDNYSAQQQQPIQKKENNTGLPDALKSGIENLSGYSMDDVKVHYNSDKPTQLQAHAYAQGTDIHLASGQEKHLPHEAWHVVQQKQGRVKPTMQIKGKVNINDDVGLEKEADVMGAKAIQFVDNRPETIAQRKLPELTKNGHQNADGPLQKVDWTPEEWAPAAHPDDGNRASDPYELQNGQVHHIISHSHLVTGLNHLDQAAQNRVRRSFLPSLNVLNIRQLATVFPNVVFTNPNAAVPDNVISPALRYFDDAPWSTAPLAKLPGNITMIQGAFINTTIDQFRDAYTAVREGATGGPGNVGTLAFWQEVLNSFFEWSGGNLFYGAAGRAEPGGANLDELDSDAAYFRDPAHVNALKGMERRLRVANQAINAHDIEAVLTEIGVANRDAGAGPVNAPGMWFAPAGAPQETFVAALLPAGTRRDYVIGHAGRNLPRALLREQIRSTATAQINPALRNDTARANFAGVVSAAANNAHLWKGKVNAANAVVLNLWGTNFTLTSMGGGDVQITAHGLQQSIAHVGRDVTSIEKAIEPLKNGLENLF